MDRQRSIEGCSRNASQAVLALSAALLISQNPKVLSDPASLWTSGFRAPRASSPGPGDGPDFLDLGPEAFHISPFEFLELFVDVFWAIMDGPSLSGKRTHYHIST